jgi:hypothetical protein
MALCPDYNERRFDAHQGWDRLDVQVQAPRQQHTGYVRIRWGMVVAQRVK